VVGRAVQPDLRVLQRQGHIRPSESLIWRGIIVECKAFGKHTLLVLGQECTCLRIVGDEPVCCNTTQDGEYSFQDEDPLPPVETSNALHVSDAPCQRTTEGTGKSCRGEEERHAKLSLFSQVEETEVVDNTREQATLSNAEEESDDEEAREIVYDALECCNNTPDDRQSWQPEPWGCALKNDVARHFEQDIANKEEGQSREVLIASCDKVNKEASSPRIDTYSSWYPQRDLRPWRWQHCCGLGKTAGRAG
jgi:hypothetical protein